MYVHNMYLHTHIIDKRQKLLPGCGIILAAGPVRVEPFLRTVSILYVLLE
jgi:hypothetical protein